MEKIKAIWNKISIEAIICIVFGMRFIFERATELQSWSSAWLAMDYSMGSGSRLLIGSIYRLFYGDFLDYHVAYKYVAVGSGITVLVLAIVLGRMVRIICNTAPQYKHVAIGAVAAYVASPWSVAYTWNWQNYGRLDVYMLLVGCLGVLVALSVKNIYAKYILFTLLGVIGLAIHQGFAFLFYPMILVVMCYDAFKGDRIDVKNLVLCIISGLINVAVAVYFQFFSSLHFDTVEDIVADITARTNVPVSDWAIEIEYFGGMKYQLEEITPGFFQNEAPWTHMLLIILLFLPILGLYVLMWKDVFAHLRANKVNLLKSPYLYVLLAHLCYVPMFLIHTDWGRHFAPWFTLPTFIFLFYMAKGEASMRYAFGRMKMRVEKHPWYFVLAIAWIAMFDTFGARAPFQTQAETLYNFLQYGFFE